MMKSGDLGGALNDRKALERVAGSPDARALAGMLTRSRDPSQLREIAERAARGDTEQLQELISSITGAPGGAELLRRLGESLGEK